MKYLSTLEKSFKITTFKEFFLCVGGGGAGNENNV